MYSVCFFVDQLSLQIDKKQYRNVVWDSVAATFGEWHGHICFNLQRSCVPLDYH